MRGVLAGRVINIKIVAFIVLHSVEYTDLMPDTIFYCTYFVRYATIYVDVSDSRSERGLRQGCCLIFLGAPPVVLTPATLSTAITEI